MMKPHVIIIMADQLRYDVLNCGFTPNIDRIGDQGVKFTRAYTSCPLCAPARGSFFTGTYPNTNGSLINPWEPADAQYGQVKEGIDHLYGLMETDWESIHSGKQHLFTAGTKPEQQPGSRTRWCSTEASYREYLRAAGQPMPGGAQFRSPAAEMVAGKITRVSSYSNANTGIYEPGEEFYFDHYFTRKALAGLAERTGERPLLLNAMFVAPHPPFQIPLPWYDMVSAGEVKLPENVGVFSPRQSPLQLYHLPGIIGSRYRREQWRESWRVYLGLVGLLDHCVGLLLDELKRQGIYDDSLIIFTSDHGEMLGSHGLFQKMCMYEEAVRVPLTMKLPAGMKADQKVYDQVVRHVDILPTLCDWLELKPRQQMDGRSLGPLLEGGEGWENTAFIQYDGNGSRSNFQRCIVEKDQKLIVSWFKDEVYYELYDLSRDGQEQDNLLFNEQHDRLSEHLSRRLAAHMNATGDKLTLPELNPARFRQQYGPFPAPAVSQRKPG